MTGGHRSDRIFLEGIEVFAYGGVTEAERQTGQRYTIDLSAAIDVSRPAETDCIDDALSYVTLHDIAVEVMRRQPFRLIETQAGRIAGAILERTEARSVMVRLRKIAPPIDGVVAAAGVEITRP